MKEELEEKIIAIAPWMFRYEGYDNLQCSLMAFGFECGDGWYKIFEKLVTKLRDLDPNKTLRVIQIKEKFGSLRFYLGSYDSPEITEAVSLAEDESQVTCEYCGAPSKNTSKHGWVSTICDNCREKK